MGKKKKGDLADNRKETDTPDPKYTTVVMDGYKREIRDKPPRKIGILGTCPSRGAAPLNDLSWEFWTIGPGGKNSNRWERLFEIHGNGRWPDGFVHYLQELKEVEPPRIIYTEEDMPEWPACVVYPKLQMFEKYGRSWFTSQIAYAVAMAIEENVTDLGIWGIDLESGEEYRKQYAGARHFIDLARLAGVNVYMPKGCGLMREPVPYPEGWETHLAGMIDSKIEYLTGISNEKTTQHQQLSAEINQLNGEITAFRFLREVYVLDGVDPNDPGELPEHTLEWKVDQLLALAKQNGQL
jgi:hypothetical protein